MPKLKQVQAFEKLKPIIEPIGILIVDYIEEAGLIPIPVLNLFTLT